MRRQILRSGYRFRNRIRLRLPGAEQDIRKITLLCNTCLGGVILSDLGLRFNSPFVDVWMYPAEFIRMCEALPLYMRQSLVFIEDEHDYPVAMLGDVRIFFRHYSSESNANEDWIRRTARMSMDNLFFLFSERNGCSQEDLKAFDSLPFKNKAVILSKVNPEIRSGIYIPGFENETASGIGTRYRDDGCRRYIDEFDYVRWFRTGQIRRTTG